MGQKRLVEGISLVSDWLYHGHSYSPVNPLAHLSMLGCAVGVVGQHAAEYGK